MRTLRRWILLLIAALVLFGFINFAGYTFFKENSLKAFKRPFSGELDIQDSYGLFKLDQPFSCSPPLRKSSVDVDTKVMWKRLMGGPTQGREADWWYDAKYNKSQIGKDPKLRVFVVPHSHVDPGWLQTVDQYTQSTNKILSNMLNYLPSHPNMTFNWMEISFFARWFDALNAAQKQSVKNLIDEGRFEIASGSWVMTDEASPYYWASIDNIIEGHQFLMENFGSVPKVAWSNDPFGYGSTVPYLFKLSNISLSVIHRIHTAIKVDLGSGKNMEFYFRQYWDESGKTDQFVHVLPYSHYDIPNTCGPSSSVCCQFDFKRLTHFSCGGPAPVEITEKNVDERSRLITDQYRLLADMYRNNVVLVMLGDDFRYDETQEWSQQHDNYMRLFDYINNNPAFNMEIQFGTFSKYFDAVARRSDNRNKNNFVSLSGDFFPYHDVSDHYWTGYYTTRPFFKRMDRLVQAMIRTADIASSMAILLNKRNAEWYAKTFAVLREARRNLAIFQHHDAITGTSKWKVVDDYGFRLHSALTSSAEVAARSVASLVNINESSLDWVELMSSYKTLPEPKIVSVETAGKSASLWIFNSLPNGRYELVTVRVDRADVRVRAGSAPAFLTSQLNPIVLQSGLVVKDNFELSFKVFLPPLAAIRVTLENGRGDGVAVPAIVETSKRYKIVFPEIFQIKRLRDPVVLTNGIMKTYHNSSTGYLQTIQTADGNVSSNLEFWQYTDTGSGAYLFSPHKPPVPWDHDVTKVIVLKGPLKEEIVSFSEGIYHREIVSKADCDEIQNVIRIKNVVDIRNDKNTEPVMRLYTNVLNENDTFFTDANGFQLMAREYMRNQRVERNYYPIASSLMIEDAKFRFSVLTGQPHGGTALQQGALELMLDRILTQDDSKGLGYDSIIRDNVPAESEFLLVLEPQIVTGVENLLALLKIERKLKSCTLSGIRNDRDEVSVKRMQPMDIKTFCFSSA